MKSTKFSINMRDSSILNIENLEKQYNYTEEDKKNNYNAFLIKNPQTYNPIYSLLFELNENNYNSIALNHKYNMIDLQTVKNIENDTTINKDIFIKFSPLLDPIKYMTGKYPIDDDKIRTMPIYNIDNFIKIDNVHNASYVDCFFCFLTSKLLNMHNFVHGIDFYGSFLGVQDKYKMNITDDLEYLNNSPFFINNLNKYFKITKDNTIHFTNYGSRGIKQKLKIEDNNDVINTLDVCDIDIDIDATNDIDNRNIQDINIDNPEIVYEKTNTIKSYLSSSSSDSSDSDSEINYSSDSENDIKSINSDRNSLISLSSIDTFETDLKKKSGQQSEDSEQESDQESEEDLDEESEEEEEEPQVFSYINNFPVQMICLEKCTGTLDELFLKGKINESNGASALFQIIMILITYQKVFHFTHNDLHTNNIMYIETDKPFLYYEFNNKIYKVPTYGRIYKIIDFGRSIYKYNNNIFCSDSFAPGGDAHSQYNFEPFFNENKPRLNPNYSFDLCRLGCSIYDFIIDEDDDFKSMDEFQKTIYRWCLDDEYKNVLYKKNGKERYPNFKLYKMISRTVHNHTPDEQLTDPFFAKFQINKKLTNKEKNSVFSIDKLPIYV